MAPKTKVPTPPPLPICTKCKKVYLAHKVGRECGALLPNGTTCAGVVKL